MRGRTIVGGATAVLTLISLAAIVSTATAAPATASATPGVAAAAPATTIPGPGHDKVVSEVPPQNPTVLDGAVWAFAEVGNTMVVGGNFTQVSSRNSATVLSRPNIFVFDETTGQVSATVVPELNGKVEYLQVGPIPGTVYAAGAFTTLNGAPASHLALIDVSTGLAVPGFRAAATNGVINDLRLFGNRLYAGGFFTTAGGEIHHGLTAFDATTGKLDPFMNVQLDGHHNDSGTGAQGSVGAKSMDITPNGTQLVVIGNFRTADTLPRNQAVLIDLTGATATVRADWRTRRYEPYCSKGAFDSYMRGVDFSVDGSFFIVVTTGGPNTGTLCDTAARFETSGTGDAVEPTWVDETGGDTLWSVEITEQTAYIGGHNRWFNNSSGRDSSQAGAVPRPGIAALDLRTGLPIDWNPGRNPRGVSAYELYATPRGLWVGQDTDWIGNRQYKRGKMAFFPLSTGYRLAPDPAPVLPGTAYLAAKQGSDNGRVLFRVNAGGPQVTSQDVSTNWLADTSSTSTFHTNGNSSSTYAPSVTLSPSVPAGTPTQLFDSERWDTSNGSPDMDWFFPVAAGTPLEVRLYFANRCSCSSGIGQRVFNVSIDNVSKLSNFDVAAAAGSNNLGIMRAFPITSDGTVNINFDRLVGNPVVNAIEIVRTDRPEVPPSTLDDVSAVGFDGTNATAATTVANAGVAWRNARGAFWLAGKLYNGWADGTFTSRSFDGTTFGAPTVLAPWADPVWAGVDTGSGNTFDGKPSGLVAELPNVTGMFYLNGRLYYTLSGSSTLFYRYFSPDSGIVGSVRFQAPAGFNFSTIKGMFYTDGNIYAALSSTGDLVRIGFTNGVPAASSTTITGPSSGGVDWRSRALFMIGAPPNQPPSASFTVDCTDQTCAVDATASSDQDGTIGSYTWDYGDGSTDTGITPQAHPYADPGNYVITLTVTDDDNASATTTRSAQAVAPNQAPTAIFSQDCASRLCAFDGRGSSDPDGIVASYAWDFGDGTQGMGSRPSHRYTDPGSYDVTLTVTDDDNAVSDVFTQQIVVADAADAIAFVGRASATSNVAAVTATIPATANAGDTALLMVTHSVIDPGFTAPTGVTGWTEVETRTTTGMATSVWSKVLEGSDPGSTVTVTANRDVRSTMTVGVWSGADPSAPVSGHASAIDASTLTHVTPTAEAHHGDLVVSFWSDKSSTTTSWTPPGDVVARGTSVTGGSGRVTSLLADSGASVPQGLAGGLTATTNLASTRGISFSLLLSPPPPNQSPTAAFTTVCHNQSCSFDSSGSRDDVGIVSYLWDFDDGTTDTTASPDHPFTDPGSYDVSLTVTDGDTLTDSVTHTVVVQAPHISAIAATKANGTVAALSTQVPALAQAGDTAVLVATHNVVDPNLLALSGWTLEDTRTSVGMVTNVWSRTLTAGDAGSTVTVTADRSLKTTLSLAVYRGVDATADGVLVTSAADAATATHVSPTTTTTAPTWVLSYFADKSAGTTVWTPPNATQSRAAAYTTGSGRVTSLLVDTGDVVPAGTVGGYTATTDATSTRGVVMTIVLGIAP